MAEPLPLDPAGYGGAYKLIGGTIALDFANLVSYRDEPRRHDWLDPIENLHRWATATSAPPPTVADEGRARDLREALATVFLAISDREPPPKNPFAQLADLAHEARTRQHVAWREDCVRWVLPDPTLTDVIVLDAFDLLVDASALGRVEACEECLWVFLDSTRNRSRRYCDPADCGNRARQRRFERRST